MSNMKKQFLTFPNTEKKGESTRAAYSIFDELYGVLKCGQKLPQVFE